jgi:hypothetical protein
MQTQQDAHVSAFIVGCDVYPRFLRWELGTFGVVAPTKIREERLSKMLDEEYEKAYGVVMFRFASIYTKRIRCSVCGVLNHNAAGHKRRG